MKGEAASKYLWRPPLVQGAHLDQGCFQRARLRLTTGMRTLRKTNLPVVQELLGHTDIRPPRCSTRPQWVHDVRKAMEETRVAGS
jgi:hypothetical protein